jgi:hypothetical protein
VVLIPVIAIMFEELSAVYVLSKTSPPPIDAGTTTEDHHSPTLSYSH